MSSASRMGTPDITGVEGDRSVSAEIAPAVVEAVARWLDVALAMPTATGSRVASIRMLTSYRLADSEATADWQLRLMLHGARALGWATKPGSPAQGYELLRVVTVAAPVDPRRRVLVEGVRAESKLIVARAVLGDSSGSANVAALHAAAGRARTLRLAFAREWAKTMAQPSTEPAVDLPGRSTPSVTSMSAPRYRSTA
jgi:hypothetical protein